MSGSGFARPLRKRYNSRKATLKKDFGYEGYCVWNEEIEWDLLAWARIRKTLDESISIP
jgi:hypothetical protein